MDKKTQQELGQARLWADKLGIEKAVQWTGRNQEKLAKHTVQLNVLDLPINMEVEVMTQARGLFKAVKLSKQAGFQCKTLSTSARETVTNNC